MGVGETLLGQFVAMVGLMAAAIAVGGFLGHVHPALGRKPEEELRAATVIGGLWGLGGAIVVIVLSVFIGEVTT